MKAKTSIGNKEKDENKVEFDIERQNKSAVNIINCAPIENANLSKDRIKGKNDDEELKIEGTIRCVDKKNDFTTSKELNKDLPEEKRTIGEIPSDSKMTNPTTKNSIYSEEDLNVEISIEEEDIEDDYHLKKDEDIVKIIEIDKIRPGNKEKNLEIESIHEVKQNSEKSQDWILEDESENFQSDAKNRKIEVKWLHNKGENKLEKSGLFGNDESSEFIEINVSEKNENSEKLGELNQKEKPIALENYNQGNRGLMEQALSIEEVFTNIRSGSFFSTDFGTIWGGDLSKGEFGFRSKSQLRSQISQILSKSKPND